MISDLEEVKLEADIERVEMAGKDNGEAPKKRVTFVDVLRHANFRNLWLGQIVSQIGDYFALLALMVVVSGFSNTAEGTALSVSALLIAFSLPRLLFGLLAGVFVDRWDRRNTMLFSDLARVGLALGMIPAFLTQSLPPILVLAFLMSTVGTLFNPAKGALIPLMVPDEQLLSANALSQSSQMLATVLGPALAGSVLTIAGTGNEWVAMIVDSSSFLISAFTIWLIRMPAKARTESMVGDAAEAGSGSAVGRVWQELLVGFKALVFNRVIGLVSLILAVTMLGIGAINVLWVVFLKTQFGYVETELAWRLSLLDMAFASGMIVSIVLTGNFLSGLAPKWFLAGSLFGVGLPVMVFGYLPDYTWLLIASVLMGVFVAPIETGVSTLMQIVVPNRMLGRVGGGIGSVTETSTILSMSVAGVAGAAIGIPLVFAIAGALCVAMGVASAALLPRLTLKDKVAEE